MHGLKILLRKRWVRILLFSPTVLILIEALYSGWAIYRLKQEADELGFFRNRILTENFEKTCPKEMFKTKYSCFREKGASIISRSWDSSGTILLMNIGIMTYADDKSKQRCSDAECTANLLEFILDILEPFLKKHAPSQWSIIIADHIDRDLQSKFAASFIEKTDSVIREIPKKIAKETDLTVINRLKRVVSRYEQLRPLALDRQKIDDSIVRILKIYRSITN